MLLLSFSLHSYSPSFKLLYITSYGGELLLDSYFPWNGVSNHLSSFSIPLPLNLKNQITPLMKKIQDLQAPRRATSKINLETVPMLQQAQNWMHTRLKRIILYLKVLALVALAPLISNQKQILCIQGAKSMRKITERLFLYSI